MGAWLPRTARVREPLRTSLVGVSKWELDTPALCVDLDKLEQNIATMRAKLAAMRRRQPAARQDAQVSGDREAAARRRLDRHLHREGQRGGSAVRPTASSKILMTTSNVTANKIRRAMAIRKANRSFIQAVDYPQNARELNDAAKEAGIVADVVVDVAIGTRSGIPAGDQALALAQLVDKLPNLKLRGMHQLRRRRAAHQGIQEPPRADAEALRAVAARPTSAIKQSGLSTEIFSGGGTGTYNILPKVPGVTDVQVGSYIFMDCQYLEIGGEIERRGLHRLRALADRHDDGAEQRISRSRSPPTPARRR